MFSYSLVLRDNIVYGHLDADETQIWNAIRNAQLETFIANYHLDLIRS